MPWKKRFSFKPPREHGHNTVMAIGAMEQGRSKVFIALGGNFAQATPDTPRTHAALRKCDLTVHIATKLNRSHLVTGRQALILPCLGRTDIDVQAEGPQGVTVEDTFSMIHISHGQLKPKSRHLLSEPAIIAGIAAATLGKRPIDWNWAIGDYARIRNMIADTIPGFEESALAASGRLPYAEQCRAAHLENREWQGAVHCQCIAGAFDQ